MTAEGRVVKKYFHKFKQINKFLEFIDNEVKDLSKTKINCLDFGCGKSYLTFAMYYYFRKKGFKEIKIVGLDLKKDVIQKMNELAKKLNYTGLEFLPKDIREYSIGEEVDLLVTLHACDTLTDIALKNAAEKKIKTILSVPCCQHELFDQLKNRDFNPILEYGILKEKFSSILTDALRACYLKTLGYDVKVVEFIDVGHTPKNILIKAKYTGKIDERAKAEYKRLKEMFAIKNISIEK